MARARGVEAWLSLGAIAFGCGCGAGGAGDEAPRLARAAAPLAWGVQRASLTATSGAKDEALGHSVALSGDVAVVGAPGPLFGAASKGRALVFSRAAGTWSLQQTLTASDGADGDAFGVSVALRGDVALIGASFALTGTSALPGAAYVFVRSGGSWTEQAKLAPAGGAAGDVFGVSVGLDAGEAIVGAWQRDVGGRSAQGAAYVFTQSGAVWSQQAELAPADGAAFDGFGYAVALRGDRALVGARGKAVAGAGGRGAAYVFARSGVAWSQEAQLVASDGAANDSFGASVALDGASAAIGAPGAAVGAKSGQGAAYVFVRGGSAWTQEARLIAASGAADDDFGYALSLAGDTLLVGANFATVAAQANRGAAFVATRTATTWGAPVKLVADDGAGGDFFGAAVALDGARALVGAPGKTVSGAVGQGGAYVFEATLAAGDACAAASECLTGFCVDGVCCDAACAGACQACDVAGAIGTCSGVSGAPRAGHPSCAPYVCAAGACGSTCASGADCAVGFSCEAKSCVPKRARCSADRASSISADDVTTPCGAYLCAGDGECAIACGGTADCAQGHTCDLASSPGQCKADAPQASPGDAGGCAATSRGAGGAAALLLLVVPGLGLARRRRRLASLR